ncbi:MAG: AmmeMemoRadiSam system radical SAM enzyme [Synergistaceae bacterium]|nr:AmmeMemoRadiSam system radical SAM enzyme [Synergistaceae bacterium]
MIARLWKRNDDGGVSCFLCFRNCKIEEGGSGACGVRFNENGVLISPHLGKFCACAVDPIEKKPLYHWRPGTFIYSLGSVGCTMNCPFCQNHRIARPEKLIPLTQEIAPYELVKNVESLGLNSVAFTYNEPTLQAEYICDSAPLLHENGIVIVLVTNGAMSNEAASELISCIDAANIDIKAFSDEAYKILGGNLETVKNNIKAFIKAGIHTELTHLVVPGINDNMDYFADMVDWIAGFSRDVPLHISRYFPARNYREPPTNLEILYSMASIAKGKLKYVHLGNIS